MKQKTYKQKLDLIVKIFNQYLTKKNKELLFEVLRDIQKDKEISLEFIRYLLLGIEKSSDSKNCKKARIKKVYAIINNFRTLLKKRGIKIELRPVTYYSWRDQIDKIKRPEQKYWRFFKV